MAGLDAADFRAAVISYPAERLIAGRVVRSQQDVIVRLEGAVVINFIMHPEITEALCDRMLRVAETDGEVHVVLIAARVVFWCLLLGFIQVVFCAYYAAIFGPVLECRDGVVQCEQAHAALEQGDEILPSLWRYFPGHVVEYDDVIIPIGDIFKYLAVVVLGCFDVLYVLEGVKHFKEGLVLEVVAAGDYNCSDFFRVGLAGSAWLQGELAGANAEYQQQSKTCQDASCDVIS